MDQNLKIVEMMSKNLGSY